MGGREEGAGMRRIRFTVVELAAGAAGTGLPVKELGTPAFGRLWRYPPGWLAAGAPRGHRRGAVERPHRAPDAVCAHGQPRHLSYAAQSGTSMASMMSPFQARSSRKPTILSHYQVGRPLRHGPLRLLNCSPAMNYTLDVSSQQCCPALIKPPARSFTAPS
jgi:hypothetical protein